MRSVWTVARNAGIGRAQSPHNPARPAVFTHSRARNARHAVYNPPAYPHQTTSLTHVLFHCCQAANTSVTQPFVHIIHTPYNNTDEFYI